MIQFPKLLLYFCIALLGIVFSSCTNDLEKVRKITFKSTDPDEKTSQLFLTYTDSGMAKIRLYAPLAESFGKTTKILKFREGLKLEFYNEKGTLSSVLTAQYGEMDDEKGWMKVRDSVRVFSPLKNEMMETEAMYWNKKDSIIYTDKLVAVRSPKATFYGEGLRMKQDFSSYVFIKPRGKFSMDGRK